MKYEEYFKLAPTTAIYNEKYRIIYPVLGLVGEVAEFHEKISAISCNVVEIAKEGGDITWYLSAICRDMDIDPELLLCSEEHVQDPIILLGKLAELVKKGFRDEDGSFSSDRKGKIVEVLGQVMNYLLLTLEHYDLTLLQVMEGNIKKLLSRRERGVLKGDGDNR